VAERCAPVLVFAWGNPSRGDDALGTALHDRLLQRQAAGGLKDTALLTDFQLQVEHALDLRGRERVLFVDASVSARAPYEFRALQAERDTSFTTHAMSPAAVMAVYEQIERQMPPPAFLLSIRGYEFGLGRPLSGGAQQNLEQADAFVMHLLTVFRSDDWRAAAGAGEG
jgi:hydrogenase maturation protease